MNKAIFFPKNFYLWVGAGLFSLLLTILAFYFFPQTFPLINLDITMDLKEAQKKAASIAQMHNIGPAEYQSAATFATDTAAKTFIELEAGGTKKFIKIMKKELYIPYTWRVRHFKEFEKHESVIIFTPDGRPYGFVESLSENEPGAQLTQKNAQNIAESIAQEQWNVDLSLYTLIEATNQTQPSKRLDHTFVYEMKNKTIGEGFYRLTVQVSGDKVTQLMRSIKVPESFNRRYEHMRSTNNALAWGASIFMFILYILFGCGIGLYILSKHRWLIWKPAFICGTFVAAMTTIASINGLPFLWLHYNTAQSAQGFLIQQLILFSILFFTQALLISFLIMIAESLTRRAFDYHPQLWRSWNINAASSYTILGRTLGGYFMIGFNIAFVVLCYFITTRFFKWWMPSDLLFDPNVLATYAPWFSPLALSLNAGVMEECLFRAIPLAGAALLGNKFGNKRWWIIATLIVQALIFGAAHANYPTQPAYARIIELFIPSIIWGIIYLYYGLIPIIIMHFTYDVIWFALPIFISTAPGALLYKFLIIFFSLIPLLVVLYARFKNGKWNVFSYHYKNSAWQPPIEQKQEIHRPSIEITEISTKTKKIILFCGVIGFVVWLLTTPFSHDGITIQIDKQTAINQAQAVLTEKNISLDDKWQTLALIVPHYTLMPQAVQHVFIWQEGKKDIYSQFLGNYLQPAHWMIRYAQFSGDIVARAQEYKLMFFSSSLFRYNHQLPESTPGKELTQQESRLIAHKALHDYYHLDHKNLTEVSAQEIKHPHRKDWLFVFANTHDYPLSQGQARINIYIAGDEIVDVTQTIHVPEEWERQYIHKEQMLTIFMAIFIILFIILLLWMLFQTRKNNYHHLISFNKKLFFILSFVLITLSFIQFINTWPSIIGSFNTRMPVLTQIIFAISNTILFSCLLKSIAIAAFITYLLGHDIKQFHYRTKTNIVMGLSIGMIITGLLALIHKCMPHLYPLWPHYESLGSWLPLLATAINTITSYVYLNIQWLFCFSLIDTFTQHWHKNKIFTIVFALFMGLMLTPLQSLSSLLLWLICGIALGITFIFIYKYCKSTIMHILPSATAAYLGTKILQEGIFNAYPGAILAAFVSIFILCCITIVWLKIVRKQLLY